PVYQQDAWYPRELVTLGEPYIVRDLRGQVVQVNAFQYNPATQTLRVYTNIEVEVFVAGAGGPNVLHRAHALEAMDPTFRQLYRRHFLNFDETDYTLVDDLGPMLVIAYDGFLGNIQPFVEWKNQKGIPTTLVPVSSIGNNSTAIKNYITSHYQTNQTAFVLLVGDHAQVTSWMIGSYGCDPVYAQLTGSDHYPELFIGRFSATDGAQVDLQVTKAIEYEKMPQAGADWYHKGTGIASSQGAGIGHYGESDWVHMNYIRDDLMHYTYTLVDQIYDPSATSAMVSNAMNNGRSIVNYCGHGSNTSWGTTGFNNTAVNNLTNDNMLPFIQSVACLNGNFTGTTCFAEAWLRASHNGEPSGAVAFWGSSWSQSWAPPMYAQDEFIDLMCAETVQAYGALCFNGAMKMNDMSGTTGNNETDHWTIFGDPSLQVRTATPTALAATHASSIDFGATTFSVTVGGVEGALCALSAAGQFLGNGYTNASGSAAITVTGTLPFGGSATLTVTAYNRIPYFSQIAIVGGTPPALDVTLTPVGSTQIPAGGGSFTYDATLANTGAAAVSFNAWIGQYTPAGQWQGPLLGPLALTLPAGANITRQRSQNVPGTAAPGSYTYRGYVGFYGNTAWDSSSFSYTKLSGDAEGTVHDWANWGESFDLEIPVTVLPETVVLKGSYPNPFNPSATIAFDLPQVTWVTLQVFDLQGRRVATLVDGLRTAGSHQATFDATGLPSGLYLYRLNAGGLESVGKMMLVK
ncbi:MAG: T9SS C-terminal target domain-containing protein, partial [Candidatus Zixiibacteriota bacterium]